jgi:hypothetical protein
VNMSALPIVHGLSMEDRKTGAPGRTRTCDPRLRRPTVRAGPGPPKTIPPDFTVVFEGGRQLLPTLHRDGVSHLCHTTAVRLRVE